MDPSERIVPYQSFERGAYHTPNRRLVRRVLGHTITKLGAEVGQLTFVLNLFLGNANRTCESVNVESWAASDLLLALRLRVSLTSFIGIPEVRQMLRDTFPKPRLTEKRELLAPPLTKNYSLVATAFDYLLRFQLQYTNPQVAIAGPWVAEDAVHLLGKNAALGRKSKKITTQARERLAVFLQTGHLTDDLLESALLLAGLDPIVRGNRGQEYVGQVSRDDIEDLRCQIRLVDLSLLRAKQLCLLNPVFAGSRLADGADGDLVIDDTLMDIKCTKTLELKRDHFNQLIGYYALYKISGIANLTSQPQINNLAIYFSRYGYLYSLEVEQVINPLTFQS